MSRREFRLSEGLANRFWAVTVNGAATVVQFGKVGTTGQTRRKEFTTAGEARQTADKLIAEKMSKGYVEVVDRPAPVAAPITPVAAAERSEGAPRRMPMELTGARVVGWGRVPKRSKPTPVVRPFDFVARKTALVKLSQKSKDWVSWKRVELPEACTAEEARFWFRAMRIIMLGSPTKRAQAFEGLTQEQAVAPLSAGEVARGFKDCDYLDKILRLQSSWLTPEQTLDVWRTHPTLNQVEWYDDWPYFCWLHGTYFPNLSPEQRQAWIDVLRCKLPGTRWPGAHLGLMCCSITFGLRDVIRATIERWPDGMCRKLIFFPYQYLFILEDGPLIAAQGRRLGLRLVADSNLARDARRWLAWTEYAGLDILGESIPQCSYYYGMQLFDLLQGFEAPETAVQMLTIRTQSKLAKYVAKATTWLEKHPDLALAGLTPLAAEGTKLGQAAASWLDQYHSRAPAARERPGG